MASSAVPQQHRMFSHIVAFTPKVAQGLSLSSRVLQRT
jgi:hypothetical protein